MTSNDTPRPLVYTDAAALAKAYDHAVSLLSDYERKYGEGNFHVVLSDGNIGRAFIVGDYQRLSAAAARSDAASIYPIYPDPEGLAWMKAILELPALSYEGAIRDGGWRQHKQRTGLSLDVLFNESEGKSYCFNVLCPRCGTYREFDEPVLMYGDNDPIYCHHPVCEGQLPFQLNEICVDDHLYLRNVSDYSNLMGLANPDALKVKEE